MEEKNRAEKSISLIDIFKLLLGKLKLLILVAIIGGLLGGMFAIWRTKDINYWGGRMEFYINPVAKQTEDGSSTGSSGELSEYSVYGAYNRHVMDTMVRMLRSDVFAERVLLGANGLPAKGINDDIDAKIAAAEEKIAAKANAQADMDESLTRINDALSTAIQLENEYNEANDFIAKSETYEMPKLRREIVAATEALELATDARDTLVGKIQVAADSLESAQAELDALWGDNEGDPQKGVSDEIDAAIDNVEAKSAAKADLEAALPDLESEVQKKQTALDGLEKDLEDLTKAVDDKKDSLADMQYNVYKALDAYETAKSDSEYPKLALEKATKEASAAVEDAVKEWRKTGSYKTNVSRIKATVSYSYLENAADMENANNLARAFIYVNISVLGDENKDYAEIVFARLKEKVPEYVEETMHLPEPDKYERTNCQLITVSNGISLTNQGYTTNQAIKYAVLLAAAAFIVTCVLIIIIDRSDKRLRDCDMITSEFNVPVLAIVPTIAELSEEAEKAKKKQNKNGGNK